MLADGGMGNGAKDNDSQIIGKFVVLRNDKKFIQYAKLAAREYSISQVENLPNLSWL